jgi:hypothetical protein
MLCFSYYCLYFLFNKLRDKGRTDSAWKQGEMGVEKEGMGGREEKQPKQYMHM